MRAPSRLAVLGAGHVGPVIARLAIKAGYPVAIATSGDPEDIALITELIIPGAQPRWASDAVADADIVVLAIPLHRSVTIKVVETRTIACETGRAVDHLIIRSAACWVRC